MLMTIHEPLLLNPNLFRLTFQNKSGTTIF